MHLWWFFLFKFQIKSKLSDKHEPDECYFVDSIPQTYSIYFCVIRNAKLSEKVKSLPINEANIFNFILLNQTLHLDLIPLECVFLGFSSKLEPNNEHFPVMNAHLSLTFCLGTFTANFKLATNMLHTLRRFYKLWFCDCCFLAICGGKKLVTKQLNEDCEYFLARVFAIKINFWTTFVKSSKCNLISVFI